MKVDLIKIPKKENERVVIEYVSMTPEIEDIRSYALTKGTVLSGTTDEQHLERFSLEDVYYFEALDEKVFAYTSSKVYEIKVRLYEIEEAYAKHHFVRCSKSVVLNLMQLNSISPALNGRFFAHMKSGEKLIISRQYAPILRQTITGGIKHEKNDTFSDYLIAFLVITACITFLEGILGCLFMPDMRFGFEAYFSPPIFGFLSTLTGLVMKSKKELTVKQVLFREFIQLLLIEGIVFGINYAFGNHYSAKLSIALSLSIALVYVLVYVILWLDDQRVARMFNEQLKQYQAEHSK